MRSGDMASLTLGELEVGRTFSFATRINESDIDQFAKLSGDCNPLHMDRAFAQSRGFRDRVVHGAHLVGLMSRMLGMHLPGENCLLQVVQMKFSAPVYAGASIRVDGVVDQVSVAANAAVIRVSIADAESGSVLASGKANVGLTGTVK